MSLTIDHPYRAMSGGSWLRGNLHTHTTRSDGTSQPQEVIHRYAQAGYDFLAITDHDRIVTPGEMKQWDPEGMVLIGGNEISRHGPHLLHLPARRKVEPLPERQQVMLDAQRVGGMVIVNHPNWGETFNHCPLERMREWVGYAGMEIFNGTIHRLHGSPLATDKWDQLLKAGRRIWGFANDDHHRPEDFALGWNMVYAKRRSAAQIIDALQRGCFYASTGVSIERIAVTKGVIHVHAPGARRIAVVGPVGKRLTHVDADRIAYQPDGQSSYVRFECIGDGEAMAWTQPFFIKAPAAT